MRRYTSPEKQSTPKGKNETTSQSRHILSAKTNISPIVLKQESCSESQEDNNGKISTSKICDVFLEKIAHRQNLQFQTKDIFEGTEFKHRRIYDLMNILEGCNFLKKVSKGTYFWFGFANICFKKNTRKKQATSLITLASTVKQIIFQAQNGIQFKHLYRKISEQNAEKKLKPESIKRRVYQCCKVLTVIGVVEKSKDTYKWNKQLRQRQLNHQDRFSSENAFEKLSFDNNECEKEIQKIIDKIKTQQDLQIIIQRLRQRFQQTLSKKEVSK